MNRIEGENSIEKKRKEQKKKKNSSRDVQRFLSRNLNNAILPIKQSHKAMI